jgi:diketogulonate reductase-like aldo/keto reductase
MLKKPFGRTGVAVPEIGQGTWEMERDRAASIRALRVGLDLGMTHIDTAEMYGDGRVEELVGAAIEGRRDEVFLVSKVLPTNATFGGAIAACERSLRRLRTDRLDVYLLHWREDVPLAETFRAFDRLIRDGKIRAWGVSNFDVADLEEAVALVGEGRIACNQVLYNLALRTAENAVLPWCAARGIAVVGYRPLGKRTPPAHAALSAVARRHGATPAQVALKFLVRDAALFTIPKASRVAHARENAAADGLSLSPDDVRELDRAFPRGRGKRLPVA